MAYTKACPSLDLLTRPRFRPVSLSLSMQAHIETIFLKHALPLHSYQKHPYIKLKTQPTQRLGSCT
jgi:hypothetical protein